MCPPQSQFFYNRYFTRVMEDVFIGALVENLSPAPYGPDDALTIGAICAAQRAVNGCFGTRLSYCFCVERVRHLRDRHRTFAWLIGRDGVIWLPRWEQLWADGELWDEIEREKPFALAYRWKPEPKWSDLKIIFGVPDNEMEKSYNSDYDVASGSISTATSTFVSDYLDECSSGPSIDN